MSDLAFLGGRGSHADPAAAVSVVATITVDLPAGTVLVARMSTYNAGVGTGVTTKHTAMNDSVSSSWAKLAEISNSDGSAGVTLSAWWTRLVAPLPAGSIVTGSLDASLAGRVLTIDAYEVTLEDATVELVDLASANAHDTAPAVALTPDDAGDYLWLGTLGYAQHVRTLSLDATFTTDRPAVDANGATNANNSVVVGQYRLLDTDSESWDLAFVESAYWCAILAAFVVVPPPPPPPVDGTREFRADFETEDFHVVGASTTRRPDAVSMDYLTAFTNGPEEFDSAVGGVLARRWRVRADDAGKVWLTRSAPGNTEWEEEALLFSYTGALIVELSACFTYAGRIVVAMERPTGTLGAPEVWLYWWDPTFLTYEFNSWGSGRTPRCVLDLFPVAGGPLVCAPEVDVQLIYLKPGTGMVRLQESDRFAVEYPSVLGYSAQRYLEAFFPTDGRRLSVVYSERNLTTGRYQLRRIDSRPYPDSALLRPTFVNWTDPASDLYRSGGEYWRNPSGGTATNTYQIVVKVRQDVDAVEIVGAAGFPAGSDPVFDQQPQESAVALDAGDTYTFAFDVTHGEGTMSLPAIRARCRKTTAGKTCYSPWRYVLFPAEWPVGMPVEDVPVNCDRDLLIDDTEWRIFLFSGVVETKVGSTVSARSDNRPYVCTDLSPVAPGAAPSLGKVFCGGERNYGTSYPFPTHVQNWAQRRRAVSFVDFSDDDGRYEGTVFGPVIESRGGGTPSGFDLGTGRIPDQFPADNGLF